MWVIASIPLWFMGVGLFAAGLFGIASVASNGSGAPTFNRMDDGFVLMTSALMIVWSAAFMVVAAKVAS